MKEWVEYCNGTEGKYAELRKADGHEMPFNVKLWGIGNENSDFLNFPVLRFESNPLSLGDRVASPSCRPASWPVCPAASRSTSPRRALP